MSQWRRFRLQLPTFPETLARLLCTVVVALFVLTFIVQPFFIPSESMEHTLLVGDFLLFNKQVLAPSGPVGRFLLPYRPVERGDIVVFHHSDPPLLVKRVVGLPGDHLRIENGHVLINGVALKEPYATFEPVPRNSFNDNFPRRTYTDPEVDPAWWRKMQRLTQDGELVIPRDDYFVLGDNRNHSFDSRFWGFVPRGAIVATPVMIYFSLRRPSTTDRRQGVAAAPRGHGSESVARLMDFARWHRIFRVVR